MSRHRSRSGFTILELVVAMSVTLLALGIVVPFFRTQSKNVHASTGRFIAQQNVRFGLTTIDRELRVAGIGVASTQPLLVQADGRAITFNTDLVSRLSNDIGAVYFDPDVPASAVSSLSAGRRVVLPLSGGRGYPDSTYTQEGGAPSTAETISFWVAPDTARGGSGLYALYRRVNDAPPEVVAGRLVIAPGERIFRYFKRDTLGRPTEIPAAALPLYHSAPIHGSPEDTAGSALTDSIHIVRVRLSGQFTDRDRKTIVRTLETGIRLMNAGLLQHTTCGDPPIFTSAATAEVVGGVPPPDPPPNPSVVVRWLSSEDEVAGERDVERYAVYRRVPTDPTYDEPFASIPAGEMSYAFTDTQVAAGESWVYGVVAQDCSGQLSPMRQTASVVIP